VSDSQILVNELGGVGAVGMDAADTGSRHDHNLGLFPGVEFSDSGGIQKIKLASRAEQKVFMSARAKGPDNGGADHPTMTGDVNPSCGVHG
jgi:hypothetical protein